MNSNANWRCRLEAFLIASCSRLIKKQPVRQPGQPVSMQWATRWAATARRAVASSAFIRCSLFDFRFSFSRSTPMSRFSASSQAHQCIVERPGWRRAPECVALRPFHRCAG